MKWFEPASHQADGKVSKGGAAGPGFEPQLPTLVSRKAAPKEALIKKTNNKISQLIIDQ